MTQETLGQSAIPTRREQELELEVWKGRMREIQANANLIQAQSQLLNIQARECQENITKLEAVLKPADVQPTPLKAVEG